MRLTISEVIERPIDEVFAYHMDFDRRAEWAVAAESRRQLSDGPLGVGTRLQAVNRMMGRRIEFVEEFTTFDAPGLVVVDISGEIRGQARVTLQESGGATTISLESDTEPSQFGQRLIGRILGPLIKAGAKRAFQADYSRLKQQLEAGAAART